MLIRPEPIQCPKCDHHCVVKVNETKYVCLNCRWFRNVRDGLDSASPFSVFIAIFVLVFLLVLLTGI
jgi:hypothetical protein